jgi:aminopeptidase YwaD
MDHIIEKGVIINTTNMISFIGMTKKFKLFALLLIAVVIIATVGVLGFSNSRENSDYTIIGFDSDRAYSDCEYLTSLGPRLAGTDEEYQGAMYIKSQFEDAGLQNVHLENFEALLYEVNSASVSLVTYGPLGIMPSLVDEPIVYAHTLDFVVQGYSGSYSWSSNNDDLEIVDLGDGNDDTQWESAQGSAGIISQDTGVASNTELFFKAEDFGLGRIGEELGYLPISKSTGLPNDESDYPDLPFFMVSNDVGEEIKEGITSNMKLRLDIDVTVEYRDFWVVLGDVPGFKNSDEFVMLGAHHDTVYNGDGAIDNTVGTVTIIELARQLAKKELKRTVRLATWGAEEEGLFGSINYFDAHRQDILDNCLMYLNFDMNNVDLARGNALPMSVADNKSISHMENIADKLLDKHQELNKYDIKIEYNDLKSGGSDQLIFARNNVKAAACWGSGSWEYHTYLDNIDHVNTESLSVGGRIFGSYALYLANK